MADYEMVLANLEKDIVQEARERDTSPLDIRKERFAAYLTEGLGVAQAGEKIGVSVATAYRYNDDAGVQALVQKWRTAISNRAIRKMTRHLDEAIETVVEIMVDKKVSAQTRVQAAFGLMDRLGADVRVLDDGDKKVAKVVIERMVANFTTNAADAQTRRALGQVPNVNLAKELEDVVEGEAREV